MIAPDNSARATEIISQPDAAGISDLANQLQQSIDVVKLAKVETILTNSPEQDRVRAALDAAKQQRDKEQKEFLENDRIRLAAIWDKRFNANDPRSYTQPMEYGKPIGRAAYKWDKNIRGNDGNFYAEYHHVRGGTNYIYYSLTENKWKKDMYISYTHCSNCNNRYDTVQPGVNICPNCGTERVFPY